MAIVLSALLASCTNEQVDDFFKKIVQAPPSSIERDVKGHDQIYSVHATFSRSKTEKLQNIGT